MAKRILFLCIFPLFIGSLVYIFFRKDGLLGVSLHVFSIDYTQFWKVIVGTLPDFCWAFSLSNALYLLFGYHHFSFLKGSVLIVSLIVVSECLQIFVPRHFTFDILDLFVDLLAVFFAAIFQRNLYEWKKI